MTTVEPDITVMSEVLSNEQMLSSKDEKNYTLRSPSYLLILKRVGHSELVVKRYEGQKEVPWQVKFVDLKEIIHKFEEGSLIDFHFKCTKPGFIFSFVFKIESGQIAYNNGVVSFREVSNQKKLMEMLKNFDNIFLV